MSVRCGIDLGTTYSAISWYNPDGRWVEAISLDHADGLQTIPSVVYFEPGGKVVVGEAARSAALWHSDRVIIGIKRSMGDDFKTPPIDDKAYTPQQVAAEILKVLRADAELYLKQPVADVVIAVPAYFGDQQCLATEEAGKLAGLNVLDLIHEPHAAALAFAIDRVKDVESRNILVYDMGGGTFDVALITTEQEAPDAGLAGLRIETLCIDGNRDLGGLDWDRVLARLVADKVIDEYGVEDPHLDVRAEATLLKNCEAAKRQLSQLASLLVLADLQGHQVEVSRSEFEGETSDLVLQTEVLLQKVLKEAEQSHGLLTEKRIQELGRSGASRTELKGKKVRLLLCGGSTRMPMLKQCVTQVMGEPPLQHKNPELLVSMGAAYHAYRKGVEVSELVSSGPTTEQEESAPITVEESAGARPTTEKKSTLPPSKRRFSVAHVIDMFRALNLPVTDNGEQIEAKREELEGFYLRKRNSPDPQQRHEATLWFRNLSLLETERAALLNIVSEHFTQMADIALITALGAGGQKLSPSIVAQLERFAQDQCNCDPLLARRFVGDYLKKRGLKIDGPLVPLKPIDRKQPSVVDVIGMFRELNLPVTDDGQQIETRAREFQPNYLRMKESGDLQQKKKADLWLQNVERLQCDRPALLDIVRDYFIQLADIALDAALSSGTKKLPPTFLARLERRAVDECKCDPPLAQRFVEDYARKREIRLDQPFPLPPFASDLIAFSDEQMPAYNQVRIQRFLTERVKKLDDFCFELQNEFVQQGKVRPQYEYRNLDGATPAEKTRDLIQTAFQNDELGELVFHIAQYWIKHGNPRVLRRTQLHQDLGIFLRELVEQGDHEKAERVIVLLEKILV